MNSPHRGIACRRLVGVAVLALLLAQWTALLHSIAHTRSDASVAVSADDEGWGHRAGTPACDLVDHLLVGQAAGDEQAATLCPPAATQPVATLRSLLAVAALPAYEARGPPRA